MKTLTVFTPTYNRAHTLARTYKSLLQQTCNDFEWLIIDDGSTDGTRKWIESLGEKIVTSGPKFDWMGRLIEGEDENNFVIQLSNLRIRYIHKPNGGLYTGYNVAYAAIQTELCVCIDSDDYMPDNAVEIITKYWDRFGNASYAGITGLDFYVDGTPIGGYFPHNLKEGHLIDLNLKKIHSGDTKQVMRTEIMKQVSPQIGFDGEKYFNPIFMLLKADDMLPSLFVNKNLCFVEYQERDSMSAGIWAQYINSPHSFALMRRLEMTLKRNSIKNLIRITIHYNSSTIIGKESNWLKASPKKLLTLCTRPFGWVLSLYIYNKTKK